MGRDISYSFMLVHFCVSVSTSNWFDFSFLYTAIVEEHYPNAFAETPKLQISRTSFSSLTINTLISSRSQFSAHITLPPNLSVQLFLVSHFSQRRLMNSRKSPCWWWIRDFATTAQIYSAGLLDARGDKFKIVFRGILIPISL